MKNYRYSYGYITDIGNRRATNQDSLLIRVGDFHGDEFLLAAVADGMGGMKRGDWASFMAISHLDQWWSEQLPLLINGDSLSRSALNSSLSVALDYINRTILSDSQDKEGQSGTTLSLLFMYRNRYLLMHVGDTRIYSRHRNSVKQITYDHTWCRQEIDAGRMKPEEALTHPRRHMLISTLGVQPHFQIQKEEGDLNANQSFLICSDGFYQELDINSWMLLDMNPQDLLESACREIKNGEAEDNLSAILIKVSKSWRLGS